MLACAYSAKLMINGAFLVKLLTLTLLWRSSPHYHVIIKLMRPMYWFCKCSWSINRQLKVAVIFLFCWSIIVNTFLFSERCSHKTVHDIGRLTLLYCRNYLFLKLESTQIYHQPYSSSRNLSPSVTRTRKHPYFTPGLHGWKCLTSAIANPQLGGEA